MFGWRRRNDGFEWRDYVRTTVLARRQRRRENVVQAKEAAVEGVRQLGRRGAEAGSRGLEHAQHAGRASFEHGLKASRSLAGRSWHFLSEKAAPGTRAMALRAGRAIRDRGGSAIASAAPAATWLRQPHLAMRLAIAGFAALVAGISRLVFHGLDTIAVIALLIALAALAPFAASLPADRPSSLSRRLGAPPGPVRLQRPAWLPRSFGGRWGTRLAAGAVGLAALIGIYATLDLGQLGGPGRIEGRAAPIAGDGLRVAGQTVRLAGIEAPDRDQECLRPGDKRWRCGMAAAQALAGAVRGRRVACRLAGRDDDDRPLATCTVNGRDVAADLVRRGHVFAKPGLLRTYGGEEDEARTARAGVWLGSAERPLEYRAKRWEEARRAAPEGCPIKGQLTSEGRVYVLPWGRTYDSVKVRAAKGERWFCTEAEALAAGWKPRRL